MANVNLKINGKAVSVPAGTTILDAAKAAGVRIPTLCAYEGMGPHAACKLCVVEIAGEDKAKLSCAVKVSEGMDVTTDSPALFESRKAAVTEMFRQHTVDCHHCARVGGSRIEDLDPKICENCFYCDCVREGFCELQALAREFGVSALPFEPQQHDFEPDCSTDVILRDPNKCVKCRRCVDVCKNTQAVGVLGMVKTDKGQTVGVTTAATLAESACIRCGRCVDVCPTGAVALAEHKDELVYFAHRPGVKTAALVDESVLPELEALYGGAVTMGQLASALRRIGVDKVYDAEEVRLLAADEAAQKLSKRRRKAPAIVAFDPAAKAWLAANCAEHKADFVFPETAQMRFAALTAGQFDKVFRISGKNGLAAEVHDAGCADWFYNARELFRILKRTGADPTRRPEETLDLLGLEAPEPTGYAAVLGPIHWEVGGEPETVTCTVGGKEKTACICRNPAQLRKALQSGEAFDLIRLGA